MPAIEDDAVLGAGTAVVAPARAVCPALAPVPPLLAHPPSLQGQARLSYIRAGRRRLALPVDTAGAAHHKSALAIAGPSPGVFATGECPERQRGRTVNPLAYAFVGSFLLPPPRSQPQRRSLPHTWKVVDISKTYHVSDSPVSAPALRKYGREHGQSRPLEWLLSFFRVRLSRDGSHIPETSSHSVRSWDRALMTAARLSHRLVEEGHLALSNSAASSGVTGAPAKGRTRSH